MSPFEMILIAFLVSLFIGTSKVCWGLGIAVAVISIAAHLRDIGYIK